MKTEQVKKPTGKMLARNLAVGWEGIAIAQLPELSVHSGQVLALAGPNGVGKSTIIKTLARQLAPLSGTIEIDQQDYAALSARHFSKLVAYIPQFIEPVHEMTVNEFVTMGRYPHQMWWSWQINNQDRDAVNSALEKTDTLGLRKKNMSELSGGERQRVSVAMALAQGSNFMLLDEPTAHLDFKHQLQLLTLLQELRNDGLGIIIILHDLNLIARLADTVILLQRQDGPSSIAGLGKPSDVFNFELLKDVYEVEVSITVDPGTGATNYVPKASA